MVLLDVVYLSMNRKKILRKFHSQAYGGHDAGDRAAHKVLRSGFYCPTLFKDACKFVLSCDKCQRIGNIGRRQEIPMNYSLVIEPFHVCGFDYMGPFPSSNGYAHILVTVDYVTKWVETFQLVLLITTLLLKCLKKLSYRGLESLDI